MRERVLLPVDGTEEAERAYELAVKLFPDGTLVLLHVINPADASVSVEGTMPSFPEGWYEQQKVQAESAFEGLKARAADEGVDTEQVVELGKPTRKILDTIDSAEIDHVVMSSQGRQGVSRLLLGSTAESVVRRASVPVTIVP